MTDPVPVPPADSVPKPSVEHDHYGKGAYPTGWSCRPEPLPDASDVTLSYVTKGCIVPMVALWAVLVASYRLARKSL